MIWSWLARNPIDAALGAAAVACLLAAGVQTARLSAAEARHARQVSAYQVEMIERQRAAIEAGEAFRRQEQDWQRRKAEAEASYARTIAERDRVIADLRRTADGLRDAAAVRARGPADPADDSLAACRADAARLRDVLADADAAAGDLAAAADRHAAEVAALLEAWPR